MSHLLILNPVTYQRIMLIISESVGLTLSALSFIYLDLLLYSVSLSRSFLIFLHLLHTILQHFFIFSCHLIKPFPTKKVVPFLRSLCTSPCTCLMLFLLPLLCRQIISFLSIWSSLHLRKSSSYVVFLPLKSCCTFSYPNH